MKDAQEVDGFTFYASFREAAMLIPAKNRADFYAAVIDYAILGKEPTLSMLPYAVFTAIKPVLERSRVRSMAAKRRWNPKKKDDSKEVCINASDKVALLQDENCIHGNVMECNVMECNGMETRGSAGASASVSEDGGDPITMEEAAAHADRSGLSKQDARECWDYWRGRDWKVTGSAVAMSRTAAFAQLRRWKTNRRIFAEREAKAGGYSLRSDEKKERSPGTPEVCAGAKGPVRSLAELYG